MNIQTRISIAPFIFILFFTAALAQTNPNLEQGFKPYGAYDDNAIDAISLTNFNLTVHIPIFSYPQRGDLTAPYRMIYNGKGWKVNMDCVGTSCIPYWTPNTNALSVFGQFDNGGTGVTWRTVTNAGVSVQVFNAITWDGATHQLAGKGSGGYESIDASGIYFNDPSGLFSSYVILDRKGNGINQAQTNWHDTNGNYSVPGTGTSAALTDSLGRPLGTSYDDGTGTAGCSTASGLLPVGSAGEESFPGPNGGTRLVKFCSGSGETIQTNFNAHDWDPNGNWDSIREYSRTGGAPLQSVIVFDGTSWSTSPQWSFQYNDADPGDPIGTNYGDLTEITLPTGGTITYTWGKRSICGTNPVTPVSRVVTSRTINANDGTGNHTTTYAGIGGVSTDPAGNDTVHTITGLNSSCSLYETQTDYYKGTGSSRTLLKTVKTNYSWTTNPFDIYGDGTRTVANVEPTSVTTLWPNGTNYTESQVQTVYDGGFTFWNAGNPPLTGTYGLVTEKREYDFGTNAPGALLRKTDYSYAALTNSNYATANLLDLVTQQTVYDGSSTKMAQTTNTYDGTALQASGVTTQHYSLASAYKGNLTLVQKWLNTTGSQVTTSQTSFYDTGMPYQVTDLKGYPTTYAYGSAYAGAYVTQTTSPTTGAPPVSHIVSGTYDFNTGLLTSFVDQNTQSSSYVYDLLGRMTSATLPDGGSVGFSYTDTVPMHIQKSVAVTSSLNKVTNTVFDGLGRVSQLQFHDPDCQTGTALVKADYSYSFDTSGNTTYTTQSTPYCDAPGTVYGQAVRSDFDSLGRKVRILRADGSISSTSYTENTSTVTDEAGKARKSQIDGLGRLTRVFEDPGTLNYRTDYGYSALGDLLSVNQMGNGTSSRARSFVYDSLSRLTSATNPESGTISYTYSNSSAGCAGDSRLECTKVAPAPNQTGSLTVTSTYAYDALNRLTKKSYSDGTTPASTYGYDGNQSSITCSVESLPSLIDAYPIGNRTGMCDGSGATAWAHDKIGRQITEKRTIAGSTAVTNSVSYAYNLAGSIITLTNPSGRVLTYTSKAFGTYSAGRMASVVETAHSINYLTGATYAPQGALAGFTNGASITGIQTYNSRLQPLQLYYTNGTAAPIGQVQSSTCPAIAATMMSRVYNFGAGTNDNGNVQTITDCLSTDRSQNFHYDNLNRLKDAYTTGSGTVSSNWGETYTIDPWGNLTNIGPYTGKHNAENLNAAPAPNNRLNGFCYDAAGNLLVAASTCTSPTYTYDGENRLISIIGTPHWSYSYDGDGTRVIKCTGTPCTAGALYWPGPNGTLTETDFGGAVTDEYVFFNGSRVARRDGTSNTVHYFFADTLGSTDIVAGATGSINKTTMYYPFGGDISVTGAAFVNNYKFTGKERDSESGLDEFGARYYSSSTGRWISADWSSSPAAIPYANRINPQSFNLYSYVLNNPLRSTDPDGHSHQECGTETSSTNAEGELVVHANCREVPDWWDLGSLRNSFRRGLSETVGLGLTIACGASACIRSSNAPSGPSPIQQWLGPEATPDLDVAALLALGLSLPQGEVSGDSGALSDLNKSLASQDQMGQLLTGKGVPIAGPGTDDALRDAGRLAQQYGGQPGDWQKVASSNYNPGGAKAGGFETHGYQNINTGEIFEIKTKFQ